MRLIQFAMRFDTLDFAWPFNRLGQRAPSVRLLVLLGLLMCSGCANMREKRIINAFQTGLESGNMESLRENATTHFAHKALRHPEADDALSQLKLPEGPFEILKVEDVSETEKKVTIGFGKENKRKIMYRLVHNGKQKQWKVDDIYLRQRKGRKTIAMPVTEQMDVLLSAREFFESWSQGDRQRVLDSSSSELKTALEKLPPSVLAYNISLMIGKASRTKSFRPEAHINGDQAVVNLNRSHGTIQISMEQNESGWQVSDLALTGRDKESRISSLLERVKVTNQTMAFLDAWQQNDKSKLQQLTQEKFYTAGLAPANLSDVPLPSSFEVEGKVDVKLSEARADVILNDQKQTLQITLKKNEEATNGYVISDIILYDMEQEKTVSLVSALTARPVAELFMEALSQRDSKMLRYNSTHDFQVKTWGRASQKTLAVLPMPIPDISSAHVIDTKFQGEVTQVVFEAGTDQLIVVLHDQGGRVLVDDVLINTNKNAEFVLEKSLKAHLSAIVPVYELAASIHHNQPKQTLRLVTDDFYGRVFSLTQTMPETAYTYLNHVSASEPEVKFPKSSSHAGAEHRKGKKPSRHLVIEFDTSNEKKTLVSFSGPNSEMQVSLIQEDGLLRISDASITTPGNQVAQQLKQTMRMELAQRRSESMIRTVSGKQRRIPLNRKQTTPMRKIPRSKSGQTARTNSPVPLPAGESELADRPLQNALYEQYESAQPLQQIKQTRFLPSNPRSTSPINHRSSRSISPPRQHQIEDHPLLKQIPIQ